jgi:hypothetical protein
MMGRSVGRDFIFDTTSNTFTCLGGKRLQQYRRNFERERSGVTKANTSALGAERDRAFVTPRNYVSMSTSEQGFLVGLRIRLATATERPDDEEARAE